MDKASVPIVAVLNRKGGSGKSTLATHIAGYLANRGSSVMLGDADRQQTSVSWLRRREAATSAVAPIMTWIMDTRNSLRKPAGISHIVLDTPAAMQGLELQRVLNYADAVVVPLSDSLFDMEAAAASISEIRTHPRVGAGAVRLGAVGVRIDARTRGAQALQAWAHAVEVPLVATLRVTQSYVRCAEKGLTLFDLPADRTQTDLAQWAPMLEWLKPVIDRPPVPSAPDTRWPDASRQHQSRTATSVRPTDGPNDRPTSTTAMRRPVDRYQPKVVNSAALAMYGAASSPLLDTEASNGWSRLKSWFTLGQT